MSTVPVRRRKRRSLVLRDIDWRTYSRLVSVFNERPGIRLTYDRGRLEIMSPLIVHERGGRLLGQLIVILTDELGLASVAGGSTTLRRKSAHRGLEPDECFWIANEALVRGKDRLDLRVDPPPDLAIETDVTSSSIDRLSIYAALGVPEVWRLDGGVLTFLVLTSGAYTPVAVSRTYSLVTPADLMGFVAMLPGQDDTSIRRQFRAWVRQRIGHVTP
jgi:Uma2 family endonuclease